MKQILIVLILLFVLTVQIDTHTETLKDENYNREPAHSSSIVNGKCLSGYVLECREIRIFKGNHNFKRCYCIEDKSKEKEVNKTPKNIVNISSNKISEQFMPKINYASSYPYELQCPKGYYFECGYRGNDPQYRCYCIKIKNGQNPNQAS